MMASGNKQGGGWQALSTALPAVSLIQIDEPESATLLTVAYGIARQRRATVYKNV